MGKLGLVTHDLGFSHRLTGGEVGIPGEILKVHEVVNELFSVQPATPQGAAALSLSYIHLKAGEGPWYPWLLAEPGLALDSVGSSPRRQSSLSGARAGLGPSVLH